MLDDTRLEESLDTTRQDVKTESYPMSIGELVSMYEKVRLFCDQNINDISDGH
jgi:hypothetical protein